MDTYRDYNEEKLLIMITHYPCLYDSRDANYKSLEYRENAWIQIAKEMQVLDAEVVKKKWELSKERFRRLRKKLIRSGSSNLTNGSYNMWPLFQFMENNFGRFIKTRNRSRSCKREESSFCHSYQDDQLSQQSGNEGSTIQPNSNLFIGPNPFQCELLQPVSVVCGEFGETSSMVSPSPSTSSINQSVKSDNQSQSVMPKSKKSKQSSEDHPTSTMLCEAMKLWADSLKNEKHQCNTPSIPNDETVLYCLSYAARLKSLPEEAVDEIRCQMEIMIKDARLKYKS